MNAKQLKNISGTISNSQTISRLETITVFASKLQIQIRKTLVGEQ